MISFDQRGETIDLLSRDLRWIEGPVEGLDQVAPLSEATDNQ